jgi:hypothetical protein
MCQEWDSGQLFYKVVTGLFLGENMITEGSYRQLKQTHWYKCQTKYYYIQAEYYR